MFRISGSVMSFASHRGIPLCLELRSRLPLRHRGLVRHDEPDAEQRAHVLDAAGEIPVLLYLVGWLVVVVGGVLVALLHAIPRGLADELGARVGVERRDALFRKLE